MRSRSTWAAWAVASGLVFASVTLAFAGEGEGDPPAVENTVRLELQIAGLGAQGGKIEIKPAHPGCQFKAIEKSLAKGKASDLLKLEPITIAAASTGADRDCSFEITLTEPGQKPKTFRRGLQLATADPGSRTPVRTLKCSLLATSASAVMAKDDPASKTRK